MSILIKFKRKKGSGDNDNTLVDALTLGTLKEADVHKIKYGEPAIFETNDPSNDQYLTIGSYSEQEDAGTDPINAKYVKLQVPNIAQEADNIVYHDSNGLKTINQTDDTFSNYAVPPSSGGLGKQIISTNKILITNGANNSINDEYTAQNIVKHGVITSSFSVLTQSPSSQDGDIFKYNISSIFIGSLTTARCVINLQPNTEIYTLMQNNGIYSIYVENNNGILSLVVCGSKLPESPDTLYFNCILYEVNEVN